MQTQFSLFRRIGLSSARRSPLLLRQTCPHAAWKRFASLAVGISDATIVNQRTIGRWLFFVTGMVGGLVAVGGITRLTRSGLSMVDWRPQGSLPPMNEADWEAEFNKYKAYPEYSRRNWEMSLDEFKGIFFWEYTHRMYARAVGFAFGIPMLYFGARGLFTRPLLRKIGLLFGLGAVQGGVGWWMVKSGLQESNGTHADLVRVSPYRLAFHLCMAFTIYTLLLHTAMGCWIASRPGLKAIQATPKSLQTLSKFTVGATFATAVSGAFVAGNEAGLVYNEWPRMGLGFIPSDLWNPFIQPGWRNIFEHHTWVQFQHRCLAYTTVATAIGVASGTVAYAAVLNPYARMAGLAFGAVSFGQASLGVLTLLNHVPVPLASAHQMGSLSLLSVAICFNTLL